MHKKYKKYEEKNFCTKFAGTINEQVFLKKICKKTTKHQHGTSKPRPLDARRSEDSEDVWFVGAI
jgi:hypothetical protein